MYFFVGRENKKALCLFHKRQSAYKHSAVPLSLAPPLRKKAAHYLLTQADAITGITRPSLLASSFSRRLQGDFHSTGHAVLHPTDSSLRFPDEITLPFPRQKYSIPRHHITFCPFVNGYCEKKAILFLMISFEGKSDTETGILSPSPAPLEISLRQRLFYSKVNIMQKLCSEVPL